MRTFVAIEIPEEIKRELLKIQKQIPQFNGKFTCKDNLHVTLKFFGEISDNKLKEIKEKLKKINFSKFEAEINQIGFFDNTRFKNTKMVIWVNFLKCQDLQKKINDALKGVFKKEKKFISHITIARAKSIKNKEKFIQDLSKIKFHKLNFVVDKFILKESIPSNTGHTYHNLETYELV